MAQGDVEQQQIVDHNVHNNYKAGRMNGEDTFSTKPMKKREGRSRGPRNGQSGPTFDFPLRILVPSEMVGAIIGRQGNTIHQITQETHARVDIDRKNDPNSVEKTIFIYGTPENCTEACKRILYVIEQELANVKKSCPPLKMLAHNNLIGRLIGKGGSTIKQIMLESGTKINVSSVSDVTLYNWERVISIRGESIENAAQAEKQISAKLRESYETDLRGYTPRTPMFPGMTPMNMNMNMYPPINNYNMPPYGYSPMIPPPMHSMSPSYGNHFSNQDETTYLYINKNMVGGIIGTKGSYIRNIIRYSNALINIAPLDPENGDQMERKVTIIGTSEAQWKAQFLIYEKIREAGFPPGHEDVRLKVEIIVPSNLIGRIIGKKGQNIKELQRVTGSSVKIPKMEEGETKDKDTTAIRITGPFFSVQGAQRRIRSILQHVSSPHNGHHGSSKSVSPIMENHQHQ